MRLAKHVEFRNGPEFLIVFNRYVENFVEKTAPAALTAQERRS
jgi:hypothetical protein